MAKIETIAVTELKELIFRAWKVGIVYFQVYDAKGTPNPDFYRGLVDQEPYEQIVEVPSADPTGLKWDCEFKGSIPFFGAITGGWLIVTSDKPSESARMVALARRMKVLPTDKPNRRDPDNEILLEGFDPHA